MEQRARVQHRECSVVPYRRTARGVEFCLVTSLASSRWDFPKTEIDDPDTCNPALAEAAASAGLRGVIDHAEPLGDFASTRAQEMRHVTAFLMRVVHVEPFEANFAGRRLWCLAEEARVRLRRKPLRRFIDLALHAIEARGSRTNGHALLEAGPLPHRPR